MAKTGQITALIEPEDASNKKVTWVSDTPAIATVDANGLVTAVSPGTAKITATTEDGGKTAICDVTVGTTPVTKVTLNTTAQTINKGLTYQLSATVEPTDATNKEVTWSSSSTTVATVDAMGLVTAKAGGTATITATAKDGSGVKATCAITVNVPVTGVTVSPTTLELKV